MKIILEILGLFIAVASLIVAAAYLEFAAFIARWEARHQRDRRKRERRVANLQARVNQGRRLMERYPIPTEAEALEMLDGWEMEQRHTWTSSDGRGRCKVCGEYRPKLVLNLRCEWCKELFTWEPRSVYAMSPSQIRRTCRKRCQTALAVYENNR